MTSHEHHVDVLRPDGSTEQVSRNLWRSHHGPIVSLPLLGWGLETSFSYRSASLDGMCSMTRRRMAWVSSTNPSRSAATHTIGCTIST